MVSPAVCHCCSPCEQVYLQPGTEAHSTQARDDSAGSEVPPQGTVREMCGHFMRSRSLQLDIFALFSLKPLLYPFYSTGVMSAFTVLQNSQLGGSEWD